MPRNMEYIENNNGNNRNLSLEELHLNEISLKLWLRKKNMLTDTQFCSIIQEKIFALLRRNTIHTDNDVDVLQ